MATHAGAVTVMFVYPWPPQLTSVHIPPGLISAMAAVSKIAGIRVLLRTVPWDQLSSAWLESEIWRTEARIVAMPVFSDGHERIERILTEIAQSSSRPSIVVGGPHIESTGNHFLANIGGIFRCVRPSFLDIQGVFRRAIKEATGGKVSPLSVDCSPGSVGEHRIDYSVLKVAADAEWRRFRPVVMTSLGCNRKCRFCVESRPDNRIIFRSKETIREELEWMASNLDFPYLMIADDNVLADREHANLVAEVIAEVVARHPNLHFFFLSHPEDIISKKKVVESLANLHVVRVQVGIESGCPKMRNRYGKQVSDLVIQEAVRTLFEAGISSVVGSFIIGGPYEDDSSLGRTLGLILQLLELAPGVFEPAFSYLRPYPCIPLIEKYEKGLRSIPGVRIGNTTDDRPFFETPALSERRLGEWRDRLDEAIRDRIISLSDRVSLRQWVEKRRCEGDFKLESLWGRIFKEAPNCHGILKLTEVVDWIHTESLTPSKALSCVPRCTVKIPLSSLSSGISLPFGRSSIVRLSPLQATFLSFCNGERTFKEVLADLTAHNPNCSSSQLGYWWPFITEMAYGFLLLWQEP